MIRVINHGALGYMGQVIARMAEEDPNVQIVASVDPRGGEGICTCLDEVQTEADVIIDFSTAKAVDALLDFACERKLGVVLCTTGLSSEQTEHLNRAAQEIPVLKSANMSIGINLIRKLLKEAAAVLAPAGFDFEIVERHHTRKLDAPSGTALALADALNEGLSELEKDREDSGDAAYEYVFDRSDRRMQRPKKEIGISAVRAGNIVGVHDVIMAGEDEVIEIRHTAASRNLFAKGALTAAKFLAGKQPGRYDMSDVI